MLKGAKADIWSHCCCRQQAPLLSQMHLSVFSCIPSQTSEVKHFDPPCSWVATSDGPISDRRGVPPSSSCPASLLSSLSPAEMKRAVLDPWRLKSKLTPLQPDSRGVLGGQKQGLELLSGSKAFITSRSWPLSPPVEPTAFDCLLVVLYLPGVIRLHWHAKGW